jgi:lon-related putative ATP-dependent protease
MVEDLSPDALCRRCDEEHLKFQTTDELRDLTDVVGQPRAMDAVRFGMEIRQKGYNLFALGAPGTGRHSVVCQYLQKEAAKQSAPSDWVYVNNFEGLQKPRAIQLPSGQAGAVKQKVQRLIEELHSALPSAFDSDNYRARKQAIEDEFKERHDRAFQELQQKAESQNIAIVRTPVGMVLAPTSDGEIIGPDEFKKLPETERKRVEEAIAKLQQELEKIIERVPKWGKELREKIRTLNREVTAAEVGHLIDELRKEFAVVPEMIEHFNAMERDVIENADIFLRPPDESMEGLAGVPASRSLKGSWFSRRYEVNALVAHKGLPGAPVIYEDNPTYSNLVGQIEYIAHLGALVTDFNLIKAGALHRANGGYLMLDALKLLQQPYAWDGLKRALKSSEIRIEPLGQMLGLISTMSLEPEPIPLDLKVVLVGDRLLYYLLCALDPDFKELFKVEADFADEMDRTAESTATYASLLATLARKEKLLPFDRGAVGRVIEHSSRLAGDAEKLSTRIGEVADLLREADYWARQAKRETVTRADLQQAIDAQIRRADRIRERIYEEIRRGTILIDTTGEKVGQINGLSVIELGGFSFGRPSRITARVSLGKGEVVDIEREVELGGPIHSKGVLIISGYLSARYAPDRPLSLWASLVFEQSYSAVEGDSASVAEMLALLSSLAEAPIKQSLAVTGSVNQHGQVQAIGGVNEKIEGFFDVCNAAGLTGEQGVLIPASNVKHLMLREDVIDAVRRGQFHVYPVETVDQAIELVIGAPAGERDRSGRFPDGSINGRVEARLIELAEKRRAFSFPEKSKS